MADKNETMLFAPFNEEKKDIKQILADVYQALKEKDYDPENQIIGYILSGDPTYITSHKDARNKMRQLDRDELLEEILGAYLTNNNISN